MDIIKDVNFEFEYKLRKTMICFDLYESVDRKNLRTKAIETIDTLFKDWLMTENAKGITVAVGSYRMGVYDIQSDLDILCIAPYNISIGAFFEFFTKVLTEQQEVTHLWTIEDAKIPLIKLKFNNIDVHLVHVSLPFSDIDNSTDLVQFFLLDNCFKRRKVLSSYYVIHFCPENDTFKLTCQFIRIWAKRKGIYGSIFGYLSNISWTLLILHVYNKYLPQNAPLLIQIFFEYFWDWQWSTPVWMDGEVQNHSLLKDNEIMRIMTPVQNSAYNVSRSTNTIIVQELKKARQKLKQFPCKWEKLLNKTQFFKYKYYAVIYASSNHESVNYLKYVGFVESKLRSIVGKLEDSEPIKLAHVNTKRFKPRDIDGYKFSTAWIIGLKIAKDEYEMDRSIVSSKLKTILQNVFNEVFYEGTRRTKQDVESEEHYTISQCICHRADLKNHFPSEEIMFPNTRKR